VIDPVEEIPAHTHKYSKQESSQQLVYIEYTLLSWFLFDLTLRFRSSSPPLFCAVYSSFVSAFGRRESFKSLGDLRSPGEENYIALSLSLVLSSAPVFLQSPRRRRLLYSTVSLYFLLDPLTEKLRLPGAVEERVESQRTSCVVTRNPEDVQSLIKKKGGRK
jgi:hypothetical protein